MLKASVIMSVYNGAKYLSQSIESILNQTFQDFEFIIVNDTSTDKSLEIIENFKNPKIKIINNPQNIGLTKSLNIALKESKGEYIIRMDADDISLPSRLKEQIDFMDKNPNIALAGSFAEIIDENDQVISIKKKPTDHKLIKFNLLTGNPFIHPSLIIQKNIIQENKIYNESFPYTQDYELISRLSQKYQLANIPKVLIKYRINKDSITETPNSRLEQKKLALIISHQNINNYIPLSQAKTEILLTCLYNKPNKKIDYIKSAFLYRKITSSFINKEKINNEEKKEIFNFSNSYIKNMLIRFIKLN